MFETASFLIFVSYFREDLLLPCALHLKTMRRILIMVIKKLMKNLFVLKKLAAPLSG